MSFNGEEFIYDTIGNPTTYRGKAATWAYGRQLAMYANGDVELITDYGTATVVNGEIWNHTTTFDSDAFSKLIDKYS